MLTCKIVVLWPPLCVIAPLTSPLEPAGSSTLHRALLRDNTKQVCVISGESGAGKTVSAKQFIRQLMDVSGRGMVGKDSDKDTVLLTRRHRHPIEQKIVDSNPILEAFGNAQTVMNNNSSRFGKFIEVLFDDNHKIAGGSLSHYLLEKGRIVKQVSLRMTHCSDP